MLVAHWPAGYLMTEACLVKSSEKSRWVWWVGWSGSVVPDLDLFYFYFVDECQHLHHSYWTHIPFYWMLAGLILGLLVKILADSRLKRTIQLFFVKVLIHLLLDSVAGGIRWLSPFCDQEFQLFQVSARYSHWILNFVFHPSFLVELLICFVALGIWWSRRDHLQD